MPLGKILWVDDEIESLQSQIMFLQNKGYEVTALTNGFDAVDFVKDNPLDVVLLPIGAYKPAFMMQRSHMNPNEAAKVSNQLRAGHLIPMHYGTFDLSDEPASEPLRTLEQIADEGWLNAQLHVPAVGQPLDIGVME